MRTNKIKFNSVTRRFQKHIQRQANYYHSNPDIDVSRQYEDFALVFSEDFEKSIFRELENYNITKQPRKNAVGLIDGVIIASPYFLKAKTKTVLFVFLGKHSRLFKESMALSFQQWFILMKKLLIYICVLFLSLKMPKEITNYLQRT